MYEIFFKIKKIVNLNPEKNNDLSWTDVPDSIHSLYDQSTLPLPFYNRKFFMRKRPNPKNPENQEIVLPKKRKLHSLPTGLQMIEYASFFGECLMDSVCSDKAEEFTSRVNQNLLEDTNPQTDNNLSKRIEKKSELVEQHGQYLSKKIQSSNYHEDFLYYDDLLCFYLSDSDQNRQKIYHKRWQVDISGLPSCTFEQLLALALIKKAEKSLSFTFKIQGDMKSEKDSVFITLPSPCPTVLIDSNFERGKCILRIEVCEYLNEISDGICCGVENVGKIFEDISARQPFPYLLLGETTK